MIQAQILNKAQNFKSKWTRAK